MKWWTAIVVCMMITAGQAGGQTRLVRDVRLGPDNSYPDGLVGTSDALFFVADDGVHGRELWRSDGMTAGTHMVIDLNPGPDGAFPNYDGHLLNFGGRIFFGATNGQGGAQLWQSDGTATGTLLVKDVAPGEFSEARNIVVSGSTLYFMAFTGLGVHEGGAPDHDRLWRSDGTSDGTVAVADLGIFARGGLGEYKYVAQLQPLNDLLLATTGGGTECCQTVSLLRVDTGGTSQTLYSDYRAGGLVGLLPPHNLTVVGSALFFTADAGYGDANCRLWRTDGSAAFQVAVPGQSCDIDNLAARDDGTLFFTHYDDPTGTGLWRVDASGLNPTLIAVPPGNRGLSQLTQVGRRLFFLVWTGDMQSLWTSDGTAAGTAPLRGFTGPLAPSPTLLTNVDGTLVFVADDSSSGPAVWKSDGTPEGTVPVGPLPNDPMYDFSPVVTKVGNDLFFVAQDAAHGAELWALPVHALDGSCPGDCDLNRAVTVDEVVVSVRIALGETPLSACQLADFDGDGEVTVDELIVAVSRALNGCG